MGTRNLTMVISKEETKVAQYGQWDGYPEGQGVTVLKFLSTVDMDAFKKKLESVKWVDDEKQAEIEAYYKSIGVTGEWVNMEQSEKIKNKYPLFSRDNGAGILNMIMASNDNPIYLLDKSDFLKDTLFCEWAYKIDLDKGILYVYSGDTEPSHQFNISQLPTEEEFLAAFVEEEND